MGTTRRSGSSQLGEAPADPDKYEDAGTYDVIVVGGGHAGVGAAFGAVDEGATVAVIMQAGHITAEPLAVTDAAGMPGEAERFEMFRYACEYLPQNGYSMYAAGCFARPGFAYRARAMEWNGDAVIGMGVNGGSVYDGYAVRNTNNLKLYLQNAGDFEKLTAQAVELDENAQMLRYLRGRMHLTDGVTADLFAERFGQAVPEAFSTQLDKAVENGLAEKTDTGWSPTVKGLFREKIL